MPGLFYGRVAFSIYLAGLLLTLIFNIYNGRRASQAQTAESKANWSAILFLRGLLLYPSIILITYWYIGVAF